MNRIRLFKSKKKTFHFDKNNALDKNITCDI